ncbi:MAG TPA: hypothetical protein VFR02_08450, partial [bacterium]|nr:hypothetical protein [bacterium]
FFESRVFRPFALPGKYSYGNYLFHGSVLFFAAPLLSGWGVYPAFLAFAAASTALAALSFHFFEVPANRWVRERLGAR